MSKIAVQTAEPAIPFVEVEALDLQARAVHDRIQAAIGFMPNSMLTYLHRPAIAAALIDLRAAVYAADDDSLPATIQARLGLICSSVNGCAYCTSHQCSSVQSPKAQVQAAGLTDAQVADLISGKDEGNDPVERACYAFARAASFDPGSVSLEMLQELRTLLTPSQIVQLAAIVGKWKMINLIHDGLHLPIEDSKLDYLHFFEAGRGLELGAK